MRVKIKPLVLYKRKKGGSTVKKRLPKFDNGDVKWTSTSEERRAPYLLSEGGKKDPAVSFRKLLLEEKGKSAVNVRKRERPQVALKPGSVAREINHYS